MTETSNTLPPKSVLKGMVRKGIETVLAVKAALSEPDKKDQYVNRRPALRPTVAKKQKPCLELLRFRKSSQRKRRKLNRQANPRGFKFRYA